VSTVDQRQGQAVQPPAQAGRTRYLRLRPRFWHKLALIGLAFMLPLAVSSWFLAIENGRRIHFSENELRGLAYLRPLNAVLVDLGRHRTLNRQVLSGEQPTAALKESEARVDADFAALLDAERRLGTYLRTTFDQVDSATLPAGLVQHWQALRAGETDLTSSDAGHDALVAEVRKLIGYVGITSNLTLEPELDTYYAADALVVQVPELADRIRQLGDSVAELTGERYTFADRTRVASTVALLDLHTDALHEDLFTVFRNGTDRERAGPFRAALEPLLQTAYTSVTDLRELTMRDFVRATTVALDRAAYARAVAKAVDAVTALRAGLDEQETRLLRLRLAHDGRDRLLGVGTVLVALATAASLTIWLSRRITRGVGVVSGVASELAGGDLTRRVPVRGGDEIGALALAFNSMATRLQETVEEQSRSQRILQTERDFVNAVVDVASSLVLVLDRDGRIVRFNRACEVTTGYLFAEVEGRPFDELFTPTDGTCAMAASVGMPASAFPTSFEDTLVTRGYDRRHIAWSNAALVNDAGDVTHVIATGIDVTEPRAVELGLREAQDRFRLAFDNAPIGMCLVAADERFMRVNLALCEMLGYSERDLLDRTVTDIVHPDDIAMTRKAFADMSGGKDVTFHAEKRYLHADGHVLWALVAVSVLNGPNGQQYAVAQILDITERRAAEEQLVHQATHDPLTGLPNRVLLMDRLQVELSRGRLDPTACVAVVFVDLDGFKAINDGLGHDVADQVLVEVALRLRDNVRPLDTVARLGGDEFVIMCKDVVPGESGSVIEIGERLVRAFGRPIVVDGTEVTVTASIGIAYGAGPRNTAEDLIRDADTAMYRAKARGKNRYEVFDETLRGRAADRVSVERALRTGLRDGRFRLFFQPVVDVRTAAPVAVEALVRLDDPERGLVAPDTFISAAEDSGLIVPIGAWALADACRQLADWRATGTAPDDLHVAVNLSVRQASRPDLVDTVVLALVEAGLPPQALALEVTETVLIEADATTVRQLAQLRDMGIHIGIDDFGTGYSSLTYLKQLPVSFLKIDRSFVSGVVDDPSDRKIVIAVIRLAQALGLVTIAEGVEDYAQLAMLRDFGCDQAQGYLFGRPQPESPVPSLSFAGTGEVS
jgi:diguanylate cyclase (GGDEF)-like protein/PAS domain S-box-containing protein